MRPLFVDLTASLCSRGFFPGYQNGKEQKPRRKCTHRQVQQISAGEKIANRGARRPDGHDRQPIEWKQAQWYIRTHPP